jgi:hypothetical protein
MQASTADDAGRVLAETETQEQRMPGQELPAGPRIVAAVDGSPSSMSALRWAVRQAGLNGATVDAVTAWIYPANADGYGWAPTAPISWWWAAAGTADSPRLCSARSASTACITRTAPLS